MNHEKDRLPARDARPPEELRSWSRELGCSERELREALRAVGVQRDTVNEYLLREPA